MSEDILKYIRANWSTYSREAITAELLKQGYSQEDIDNAWKTLSSEGSIPVKRWDFWLALLAFYPGVQVVVGLLSLLIKASAGGSNTISFVIVSFPVATTIGLLVSVYLWQKKPVVAKGLLAGVILSFVIPFVPIFIILGICLSGDFRS